MDVCIFLSSRQLLRSHLIKTFSCVCSEDGMIALTIPGTKIWGSKARDCWDEQLRWFLLGPWLSLGRSRGWGRSRGAVLSSRWRLRGQALPEEATAEVRRTAAPQGVELPQLVPQEVPQGGAANGAAEAGQQEVATGAGVWRQVEGVVLVIPLCLHDGGESGLLQNSKINVQH